MVLASESIKANMFPTEERSDLSEFPMNLLRWADSNAFLSAFIELALGFLPAMCVGYLVALRFVSLIDQGTLRVSKAYLSLLFACATWSIFFSVMLEFTEGNAYFGAVEDFIRILVVVPIILSPISLFVGLPAFVLYIWRRPVLRSQPNYPLACMIVVTSYIYSVFLASSLAGS
jgi:hypothetical protein